MIYKAEDPSRASPSYWRSSLDKLPIFKAASPI